jgi:hypothetical protein
LSGSRSKD